MKSVAKLATVNAKNYWQARGKRKVFCIGRNKTGTTSLALALKELGYVVGHQPTAEHLADRYYFSGNFRPIIEYCRFGEAFQDVPFSWPETYRHLDVAYPGSKFILTVRQNSAEWYDSITRFHAKKFGRNGSIPSTADLQSARYRRLGFMYNTVRVYRTPDNDPYNYDIMTANYEHHNEAVIAYFRDRPEQLLVVNVADPDAYQRVVGFLGSSSARSTFPWENKT